MNLPDGTTAETEYMNATQIQSEISWTTVCNSGDLLANLGVRALLGREQVALFRVQGQVYAISAVDPFTRAAVLSRGLVGDVRGQVVVASPIYKQHFNLATGVCLEDPGVKIKTYAVRELDGQIQVQI